MTHQTLQLLDLWTVCFLVLLEALLSADNALVLAIMVRHLPKDLQRKALLYGMGGAFALRILAIILAAYIIGFWWLQLIGALYLLYLPIAHFIKAASQSAHSEGKKMGFWATVIYLNLVDTAFALDSVIVAVAVVDTVHHPDKLWVVIAGALIGIVILRFAAAYFIRLLERYPALDHVAYLLVGWAGVKLLFIAGHSLVLWYDGTHPQAPLGFSVPEMPGWLFWTGMGLIAVGGSFLALRSGSRELTPEQEEEIKSIEEAEQGTPRTENGKED